MLASQLRRFAEFDAWSSGDLETFASRIRRLRVPAGRWLVRPGRALPACFFLLEGRIRLLDGGRSVIVNAGSARARRAVYPGVAAVQTLTAAEFLNVDPALLDTARALRAQHDPGMPEVRVSESSWQSRFLTSALMQRLDPAAWQRILRAMTRESHPARSRVIEAGQPAHCCYVLCSGRAAIQAGCGPTLALLEPGSLFGEDALVSGRARNATVAMLTDGSVVRLAAERFQAWLLDVVVQPLPAVEGRPVVSLAGDGPDVRLHVEPGSVRGAGPRLSPHEHYAIVGGTWPERTLASFLLAEQGIVASPVRCAT